MSFGAVDLAVVISSAAVLALVAAFEGLYNAEMALAETVNELDAEVSVAAEVELTVGLALTAVVALYFAVA